MAQPTYDDPTLTYDAVTWNGLALTYDGVEEAIASSGTGGGESFRRKRKVKIEQKLPSKKQDDAEAIALSLFLLR